MITNEVPCEYNAVVDQRNIVYEVKEVVEELW